MKITDIKQQVKRQGRYSIFVDEKYSFSLSENELMKSGIRIGKQYTEKELIELKAKAVIDKAYMRALDLLARRPRSQWEMEDYLKRKDYDRETIEVIIERLLEANHLNDYRFAQQWVASRRLLKNTSQRRLWQELKQKRVSQEIINQVLEEDETDEKEELRQIISKKRQQTRYQDKEKLIAYLLRQGFNYGDIKDVLNQED